MLHFEGDRIFSQLPTPLWARLRDAAFLVQCIPDGTVHGETSRDQAHCTVHPGFSFMRSSLDVTLDVLECQEPTTLKYSLKSKGIGSSSEVETTLHLSAQDQKTRIHWTADVKNLGGLLKMVPAGLIRGAANKVIEDVWNGVMEKLGESPLATGESPDASNTIPS